MLGTNYRNPIKSLFPTPANTLQNILKKTRDGGRANWVSIAPSSVDVYTSSAIPGWKNSLLVSTLKTGELIRLQLNESGDSITGDTMNYFKDEARYRDVALSPDGKRIYMSIDSSSKTSGPTEDKGKRSRCSGCIVEFMYQGKGGASNKVQE